MTSIEEFSVSLANSLYCDRKRKMEYYNEFSDHLYELKNDFIGEGFDETEAEIRAIEVFGEKEDVSRTLNKELFYFDDYTRNIFKILFAVCAVFVFLCFAAEPFRSILRSVYYHGRLLTVEEISEEFSYLQYPERSKIEMNVVPFRKFYHNRISGVLRIQDFIKVLLFIPLGFFFHSLLDKKRLLKYIFSIIFIFSLELIQFWFSLGVGDIDDSISYFIGFAIGMASYRFMVSVLRMTSQIKL